MEQIKIFYDNYVVYPRKWLMYEEDQVKCDETLIRGPKSIVELTLSLCETSALFKYIENQAIIIYLADIKKRKLTRKKRKKILLKFTWDTGVSFRRINSIKNSKIFNILKDPYQHIMINDHKFLIIHFQRIIYQSKPVEFKITCEHKF